ncbi:MAG TPA: hypothetical protein VF263_02285 [Longimicrobiaceae bacterium]
MIRTKTRSWARLLALPSLLVALAAAGCDDAGPAGTLAAPDAGSKTVVATGPGPYFQVLADDGSSGVAAAVIGAEGGAVRIGEHELTVPAGAVDRPTVFSIVLTDPQYAKVYLTAIQITSDGRIFNVGTAGFPKPVRLSLSYARITQAVDPSKLLVLWTRSDGSLVPMPTTVDTAGRRVVGELTHFSGYVIGGNRDGGIDDGDGPGGSTEP